MHFLPRASLTIGFRDRYPHVPSINSHTSLPSVPLDVRSNFLMESQEKITPPLVPSKEPESATPDDPSLLELERELEELSSRCDLIVESLLSPESLEKLKPKEEENQGGQAPMVQSLPDPIAPPSARPPVTPRPVSLPIPQSPHPVFSRHIAPEEIVRTHSPPLSHSNHLSRLFGIQSGRRATITIGGKRIRTAFDKPECNLRERLQIASPAPPRESQLQCGGTAALRMVNARASAVPKPSLEPIPVKSESPEEPSQPEDEITQFTPTPVKPKKEKKRKKKKEKTKEPFVSPRPKKRRKVLPETPPDSGEVSMTPSGGSSVSSLSPTVLSMDPRFMRTQASASRLSDLVSQTTPDVLAESQDPAFMFSCRDKGDLQKENAILRREIIQLRNRLSEYEKRLNSVDKVSQNKI